MPAGNSRNGSIKAVYVEFKDSTALELLKRVVAPQRIDETVDNGLTRAVVDGNWGHVGLATSHPQDSREERIARIDTSDYERVFEEAAKHPAVNRVAPNFYVLTV